MNLVNCTLHMATLFNMTAVVLFRKLAVHR